MSCDALTRGTAFTLALKINLVFFVVSLVGCGVNTHTAEGMPVRMTKEEFADYVERVFRHHNNVVNELILATSLSDDPELELPSGLLAAEKLMVAKCQPLNDMVSATIEGREMSTWSKLLLIDQVPSCAKWSQRVEGLIEESF